MSNETKKLVIEAHIPLPDDYLDEVEIAAKAKVAADSFREGLTQAFGDGFKVLVTRVTPTPPKTPRAPRSDAGQPRSPRTPRTPRAAANGSPEHTPA